MYNRPVVKLSAWSASPNCAFAWERGFDTLKGDVKWMSMFSSSPTPSPKGRGGSTKSFPVPSDPLKVDRYFPIWIQGGVAYRRCRGLNLRVFVELILSLEIQVLYTLFEFRRNQALHTFLMNSCLGPIHVKGLNRLESVGRQNFTIYT